MSLNNENTTANLVSKKKMNRRGFLKALAVGAGGMTVLCSGLGAAALLKPKVNYFDSIDTNATDGSNRILVAYGSVCGSTGEIASAIAEQLRSSGLIADLLPVQEVKSLAPYQTLVLGSANRMGRLCQPTRQFIDKFERDIAAMQTAYFDAGLVMKTDTEENRAEAYTYLQPLVDIKEPFSMEVFGGKLDMSKIEYGLQLAMKNDTSGTMEEGDFRNWDKIHAWGKQLAMQLQPA
jgi:menaquinone-dependent protoporphyrinogen oxidase